MTYGITWATPDHSVAQTGFVLDSARKARRIAKRGPAYAERKGLQVDGMCEHFPTVEAPLFARVETEDDYIDEVRTS